MSEKRFVQLGDTTIKDTLTGEEWYAPCEYSLLDLLNEQEATIRKLQDLCGESDSENAKLRIENKKLKEENEKLIQKKCLPCELVNLQTREIDKFKEENEQLRRLFEEMKQPITINLTEEDEKELRKLLGLIDDE